MSSERVVKALEELRDALEEDSDDFILVVQSVSKDRGQHNQLQSYKGGTFSLIGLTSFMQEQLATVVADLKENRLKKEKEEEG